MMNAIIYYSNTFESYKVAKYINSKNNYPLLNLLELDNYNFNNIYLIFPVHYQSIPKEIKFLIKRLKANKAIVIATYGKMSYGHVLYDIKKILDAKIVCAAYIPSKHAYIKKDTSVDLSHLDTIIDKMNNENECIIKKTFKNPFASFFPIMRHRISVKIIRNDKCNNCNLCNHCCPYINNGIIKGNCNRCLKCITICNNKALDYKLSPIMKKYLNKKKKDEFIIY